MKKFFIIVLFFTPCLTEETADKTKERRSAQLPGNLLEHGLVLGGPYVFGNVQGIELQNYGVPLTHGGEYGALYSNSKIQIPYNDPYSSSIVKYLPLPATQVVTTPLQSIKVAIPPPPPPPNSVIKPVIEQIPGETSQPLPAKATLPPLKPTALGSGSLGVVNLGNGAYALGSGSLGYSPVINSQAPSSVPRPMQIATVNVPQTPLQLPTAPLNIGFSPPTANTFNYEQGISFADLSSSSVPLHTQGSYAIQNLVPNQVGGGYAVAASHGYDTSVGLSGYTQW